ncbi:MAG: GTPase domain-containing protein [Candidatus Sigynarchaeota archaeon]
MGKKIVFVGPPGVGKTTLRKVFFEYQSAEQLMEVALDPTYGVESILLNLDQQIGVFDLAGQENHKWLDMADKEIFEGTTFLLGVVDVTAAIDSIVDFTLKLVKVRDQACPRATIFLLAHKIDLLSSDELAKKKNSLYRRLKEVRLIKIEFTSIVRRYFLRTLKIFKNIINATLGDEIPLESVDMTMINDFLMVLNHIKSSALLSHEELLARTRLPRQRLDMLLDALIDRNLIVPVDDNALGRCYKHALKESKEFLSLLEYYSEEKLRAFEKDLAKGGDEETRVDMPPFIGFFISDLNGRTILVVEYKDNMLKQCLGIDEDKNFDLIPPFISALTSFSKEIRLVNMADFKIKGQNAIMYVFEHDQYNLIMFLNIDTNIDAVKAEIQAFFTSLIKKYSKELDNAMATGNVARLSHVKSEAKDWLIHLDENYVASANSIQFFDMTRAQQIYAMLDAIKPSVGKRKAAIETEVRLLKQRLITAIMEKNHKEIKEIAKISQKLMQ